MLRSPTNTTRRRVAAHACPTCRRLWALSGSRVPSGSWVIACKFCGWHAVRGGPPVDGGHRVDSGHRDDKDHTDDTVTGTLGRTSPPEHGHGSHGVLFHAEDQRLVAVLERYLVAGWDAGEVGLVIATQRHRDALRARLAARGLLESLDGGCFVELDAAATLEQIMGDDGVPDADRFSRTVGSLVRDHAADGTLRGFGEMVDVLWAAGNAVGALELERLWSALQDDVPFSLLCAYAGAHVDTDDRTEIVRAHDHVTA